MVRSLALERLVERMAADLDDTGWCVLDAALPATLVAELSLACTARRDFVPAGTGRHQTYQHDATVRSDAICWFDAGIAVDARYLDVMEQLRGALNLRLFLGLFDYECHYARYAPGACYRRHVDAFAGERNRVLSTVLYLNRGWRNEEGGELLLYGPGDEALATVLPEFNRLVLFLSERFPHEVKPATRARHSIAGWFRVRA